MHPFLCENSGIAVSLKYVDDVVLLSEDLNMLQAFLNRPSHNVGFFEMFFAF